MHIFLKIVLIFSFVDQVFGYYSENYMVSSLQCSYCVKHENSSNCLEPHSYLTDSQTQFSLDKPLLHCLEDNLISLKWRYNDTLLYFLEIYYIKQNQVFYTNLMSCNSYTVSKLKQETFYKIKLWSILKENQTTYGFSDFLEIKTAKNGYTPVSVNSIYTKTMSLNNESYDAVIKWNTTEPNCYFDITWFGNDDMGDYKQSEINSPMQKHEIRLKNLEFGNNYSIAIMSKNDVKESSKTWMYIFIPTCLESHNNLSICAPETPKQFETEEILVNKIKRIFDVKISWEKPVLLPDYYNVHLVLFSSSKFNNYTEKYFNISGNVSEAYFRDIKLRHHYQVSLTAHSKGGSSVPAVTYRNLKLTAPKLLKNSFWNPNEIPLILLGPIIVIFIAFILFIICKLYLSKKALAENIFKYNKDLNNEGPTEIIQSNETFKDKWEIDPKKLQLNTVLGEGAFGVVRRAWLDAEAGQMEVAIKMLKDMPSPDELREFHHEIEIMKSVGTHPNLVSMLGCITKKHPESPLLVVEYCSRGDLQTFLRTAWDKMTNPTKDLENNYLASEVSNKLYDMAGILLEDEFNLKPLDLISYGRQICLGMEYLSGLRVLHRDLAARNVLVCEDKKTIKISDFGLSRDVYKDNVYCKSGGGKLPLRWMALESMTHQMYTTYSDVWSFGILLWEIVTLGGNPYPGVATKDLLLLLKQGYRMEKPLNCSNYLYDIMMECWHQTPKDRPTFTEIRTSLESLLENVSDYLNLNIYNYSEISHYKNIQVRNINSERYIKPA